MTQNLDLEIAVIKKFVDKNKQDRFIQFTSSAKSRHKFINELAHFKFFNWNKFDKIEGNEEQAILTALQKNKITDKTCYAISENKNLDTKVLDINQVIHETVGYGQGTILVFGNAEIIYYESEEMKERYLSKQLLA